MTKPQAKECSDFLFLTISKLVTTPDELQVGDLLGNSFPVSANKLDRKLIIGAKGRTIASITAFLNQFASVRGLQTDLEVKVQDDPESGNGSQERIPDVRKRWAESDNDSIRVLAGNIYARLFPYSHSLILVRSSARETVVELDQNELNPTLMGAFFHYFRAVGMSRGRVITFVRLDEVVP